VQSVNGVPDEAGERRARAERSEGSAEGVGGRAEDADVLHVTY